MHSLVRLTLPGYNSFSRSLSVIIPGVEFGLGTRGVLVLVVLEGIGLDTLGGLDGMLACIDLGDLGSRGEVWAFADSSSNCEFRVR